MKLRVWGAGLALGAGAAAQSLAASCSFNPNQPGAASFGTLDPTSNATATFTVTLNVGCGPTTPAFTVTGANDKGPGLYRLKHLTRQKFIEYSVGTTILKNKGITLNGTIVPGSYQNAWVGDYSDVLTITVLP